VTRRSIVEYADAVRGRYLRAPKKAKTEILNEFMTANRLHRKAAIRLLNRRNMPSGKKRGGLRVGRLPGLLGMHGMVFCPGLTVWVCSWLFPELELAS
jgi:hypothetical protein